jgi:hypothetical protein
VQVGATTVVSVSWNTKELTALLLWSLHRILEPSDVSILVVDNASADGTAELLLDAQDAGLCSVLRNPTNVGHGPGLELALATDVARGADRVWILDSDCVVARPNALRAPIEAHPDAAIIGEAHWDRWHGRDRHELYSLLVARAVLEHPDVAGFEAGGDPAWALLESAERAGLAASTFPFTADGYVVHLGRASLAAAVATNDTSNPLFPWATEHHEPHFGGVDGARARYVELTRQFADEVGPDLDLVGALRS